MRKIYTSVSIASIIGSPIVVYAMDLKGLVDFFILSLIRPATTLIFGAAIVFFLWNVMMLIMKSDQPDEMEHFKSRVMWGIIAIFVMASMWGLVRFITGSLNLDDTTGQINVRTFQY